MKISKLLVSVFFIFLLGCTSSKEEKVSDLNESIEEIDPDRSNILNLDGKLFSIPSPIQTALLLKKAGAQFDEGTLNATDNRSNYDSKFKKALNLGVYGADLGYLTIFENNESSMGYFKSVRKLADDLNITGAFDKSLIERFSNNVGNTDSILVLVADAYRDGDAYLKANERNDVAGLVLAGGWVEALHFAINVANKKKSFDILNRIGEQKTALSNLLDLLELYKEGDDYSNLIVSLRELQVLFNDVEVIYTYQKPETKASERLTIIKSKTDVKISQEQFSAIAEKVKTIRNNIVS